MKQGHLVSLKGDNKSLTCIWKNKWRKILSFPFHDKGRTSRASLTCLKEKHPEGGRQIRKLWMGGICNQKKYKQVPANFSLTPIKSTAWVDKKRVKARNENTGCREQSDSYRAVESLPTTQITKISWIPLWKTALEINRCVTQISLWKKKKKACRSEKWKRWSIYYYFFLQPMN